ncbi:MAG: hypothetical protein COA49_09200 [Bacteroidetes bacterium]|nr:MAG: hypothetical protein COA49_09200 [Bacteroidota bacterium]
MKKIQILSIVLLSSMVMSSCMTTKTSIGSFNEDEGKEYVYDSGKQMWLFWGLLPIGRTDVSTPVDGSCEVITKFRFTDVLISGLTGGIVTSYTIKVKDKK